MRYLQQTNTDERLQLDLKDRRILTLLGMNARAPLTQIAKEVGLSRDSVQYRINRLTEHGVIQGYRTVIDIKRFGYDAYHIFLRLTHASKEVEERLIRTFQRYPFARAVITCRGRYDVELAVVAKSNEEFDGILDRILQDCGSNLQEYDVLITTKSYAGHVLPQSFHPTQHKAPAHKPAPYTPDEKDAAILRQLANDATMPIYAIAKAARISDDAVTYRLRKMQAGGIITRFVPVINFASLSYSVYAVLVRTSGLGNDAAKLTELLQQDRNVLWAVKCVGRYSILAYVCAKSADELNETISNLRQELGEHILDYEVLIAYEEHKYTYFPDYALL